MVTNRLTAAPRDPGADAGRLVLRLVLGILILLHGIAKITAGTGFVADLLAKSGLPPAVAYAVYLGEVVAPVLLIVGIWTRAAAAIVVVNMLVAVWLVHRPEIASLGPQGGYALELQAMFLFGAVAVLLLGAGRFSIGGRRGPLN